MTYVLEILATASARGFLPHSPGVLTGVSWLLGLGASAVIARLRFLQLLPVVVGTFSVSYFFNVLAHRTRLHFGSLWFCGFTIMFISWAPTAHV